MSIINKIKQPLFWSNFLKVILPFFVLVTLISLGMNSWKDIFNGDFNKVAELNFNNGKWVNFFGIKLIISVIYAFYITNKNMK